MSGSDALVRVGGFAVGLAVAFGAAFGIGAAVGPLPTGPADSAHAGHDTVSGDSEDHAHGGGGASPDSAPGAGAEAPAGLATSQRGYTLVLDGARRTAGTVATLRFTITGPDGRPVTRYALEHGKRLHLIVVRRDLSGYQHLHPVLDASTGRWSIRLPLPTAGDHRVFADFTPAGGQPLTLGADLHVAGAYRPRPLPPASTTATVDGLTVRLQGRLRPGEPSPLRLSVSRDGRPVRELQPYLGANGHLVVLRAGDLAYLHVHPSTDARGASGPRVGFVAEVPSAGRYRLYFDFRFGGKVRTAELTAQAAP